MKSARQRARRLAAQRKQAPNMTITTTYYSVSGNGIDDCCYLGQRYDDKRGYRADEDECWVMGHDLGIALAGVWGVDDKFVLTWGSEFEGGHHLFCFDSKKWKELPAPEFAIRAIHGPERDFLYAVGREGGVARWDGRAWKTFPMPTDEVLTSVFVAGSDEYYATGAMGTLLEGSAHGWGKLASCPVPKMPLLGVAKWKGELWVGGGSLGLYKREGTKNKLKLIKPALKANSFDTRKKLLIGCEEFVVESKDGKSFESAGEEVLMEERDGMDLGDI